VYGDRLLVGGFSGFDGSILREFFRGAGALDEHRAEK
jgi:hypothetical protein